MFSSMIRLFISLELDMYPSYLPAVASQNARSAKHDITMALANFFTQKKKKMLFILLNVYSATW